ncbi:MAG: alkaline phosphatase family protein [Gemmatimonadetes bacterium]|nr:alkaline phosphatase family protein [Gemmatimonadota bacterium]
MMAEGKLPELSRVVSEGGMAPTWVTTHCTATLAGFAEILCGYPPEITGCYGVNRHQPIRRDLTVWYRLKEHFNRNITTLLIAGKGRRMSAEPGGPYYEAVPDMDVCIAQGAHANPVVGKLAMQYLDQYAKPNARFFYFIHFKEPDSYGHRYDEDSAEYEGAIMVLDDWLGKIRQKLVELGVADTTALCVLTDHGFDEGRRTHLNAPDAWLAANWTALREGDQADVAPTILAAFGIDLKQFTDPPLPGRPLWPEAGSAPQLKFAGSPGMEDGVSPNTGSADTTPFVFRVLYQDPEGDAPQFVRVILRRDGAYYRTLAMVPKDPGGNLRLGAAYLCRRKLPAGEYQYRFEAQDVDGEAVGPPTAMRGGLQATGPEPALALANLAALSTKVGAQITFVLTADAQVEAQVLNIAGRRIGTICRAKDCLAGANTLVWSGRSAQGLAVPNGTYLVEVSAKASDGAQSRALVQVRAGR